MLSESPIADGPVRALPLLRQGAPECGRDTARAIVFSKPRCVSMQTLQLTAPAETDVVVRTEFSGISSGTERLLWSGEMPPFPGLSYPLVPGYETAGTVIDAPSDPSLVGAHVFVPGARCYKEAAGLFGGAADLLVVPRSRVFLSPCAAARETTLLALAATAYRIVFRGRNVPELVIGNGVLGRLVARITEAVSGQRPVVWEKNQGRRTDHASDTAICPSSDTRTDYSTICDVSGDPAIIDAAVHHAARDAEFVLGGFYAGAVSFEFAPAFIKELRVSISAEWQPTDLTDVVALVAEGRLLLDGLITHVTPASAAVGAYQTAFTDPGCLKMVIDWTNKEDFAR